MRHPIKGGKDKEKEPDWISSLCENVHGEIWMIGKERLGMQRHDPSH